MTMDDWIRVAKDIRVRRGGGGGGWGGKKERSLKEVEFA
ncbi:hypothetical protein E2C01_064048 [Portunus trituberculatus]|uniref:Uncharacterized protein n=1 Tax=Portunus trituberculatus TaxID=210409 RepID=A0A5B7HKP2_PORTR|nr:hypothetical protein [Portunus trituberculatus]